MNVAEAGPTIIIGDKTDGRQPKLLLGGPKNSLEVSETIKRGATLAKRLDTPIVNEFGTFNTHYNYSVGCIPAEELQQRGVGVLFWKAQSDKGAPELIFELAKRPGHEDHYAINTYQAIKDPQTSRGNQPADNVQLVEQIVVGESYLPPELVVGMPFEEAYLFTKYKDFRADGTALDLSSYTITSVEGLADHNQADIAARIL
jgi:hypothetical protein